MPPTGSTSNLKSFKQLFIGNDKIHKRERRKIYYWNKDKIKLPKLWRRICKGEYFRKKNAIKAAKLRKVDHGNLSPTNFREGPLLHDFASLYSFLPIEFFENPYFGANICQISLALGIRVLSTRGARISSISFKHPIDRWSWFIENDQPPKFRVDLMTIYANHLPTTKSSDVVRASYHKVF